MEEDKKKRRFAFGDLIVIAACILGLPLVMISLSMYGGLASPMWWTGLGIFILAAILLYRRSLEKKWLKALHWSARILGMILMLTAFFLPSKICRDFERKPSMYSAKRYVYIEGVKDGKDAGLLPEELPGDITDYYFSTMHEMPMAQDYRAYAYLVFHGDKELLRSFEAKLSRMSGYELAETKMPENPDPLSKPEALPKNVFEKMINDAEVQEDLSNALIYLGNDGGMWNHPTGALLNYQTGLIVIWQ